MCRRSARSARSDLAAAATARPWSTPPQAVGAPLLYTRSLAHPTCSCSGLTQWVEVMFLLTFRCKDKYIWNKIKTGALRVMIFLATTC